MSMESAFKDLVGGGLDDFAPKPKQRQENSPVMPAKPSEVQIERLAEAHGFGLQSNPVERRALKGGRVASRERAQPMSLRIRVGDWNKFSAFCERNDYSVAEGFARLAELADSL